jgi:predicted transcriptional regulator
MKSVKTAVSVESRLFERAEAMARAMKVSRSQLVSMALEEYLRRREGQELLARINEACEEDDREERKLATRSAGSHRRLLEGEW